MLIQGCIKELADKVVGLISIDMHNRILISQQYRMPLFSMRRGNTVIRDSGPLFEMKACFGWRLVEMKGSMLT